MRSINIFLLLTICGFTSSNIFAKYGFHQRLFLKKHVKLENEIAINEAPYIAAIIESNGIYYRDRIGTAAIITNRFLVSAQIQPDNESRNEHVHDYEIYVGHKNLNDRLHSLVYGVEKFYSSPSHQSINGKHIYKLMLIKVNQDIKFNDQIMPIALLTEDHYKKAKNDLDALSFKLVGYNHSKIDEKNIGRNCMGVLQSKNLKIDRDNEPELSKYFFELDTGGYNCRGDLGTPAILHDSLAGVLVEDSLTRVTGIFSGIVYQYEWITFVVGQTNLQKAEKDAYRIPIIIYN